MARSRKKALAVIPARIGSTRLPRKPLLEIGGREIVLRVCDAVSRAETVGEIVVATDDEEIARVVDRGGYRAALTSPHHRTGTDRIAEAVRSLDGDVVVNVQGDEPFLPGAALDLLLRPMIEGGGAPMGTLVVPLESDEELHDPNVVKVVAAASGEALYFSRAPIPHGWKGSDMARWKHVGVYAFRRQALFRFVSLPPSDLEAAEGLEQLRALDHGIRIDVVRWSEPFHGIETPGDLREARARFGGSGASAAAGGEDAEGEGERKEDARS